MLSHGKILHQKQLETTMVRVRMWQWRGRQAGRDDKRVNPKLIFRYTSSSIVRMRMLRSSTHSTLSGSVYRNISPFIFSHFLTAVNPSPLHLFTPHLPSTQPVPPPPYFFPNHPLPPLPTLSSPPHPFTLPFLHPLPCDPCRPLF